MCCIELEVIRFMVPLSVALLFLGIECFEVYVRFAVPAGSEDVYIRTCNVKIGVGRLCYGFEGVCPWFFAFGLVRFLCVRVSVAFTFVLVL